MEVSESGSMFLKAINCEGKTKDKHFIADLLINTIQEIGPQKVVQVACWIGSKYHRGCLGNWEYKSSNASDVYG